MKNPMQDEYGSTVKENQPLIPLSKLMCRDPLLY